MSQTQSYRIKDHFYLVREKIDYSLFNIVQQERKPMNYVFICDGSGSMHYVMNSLREDLKNKIKDVIKDGDTITLARFSSEGGDFEYFTEGFRKLFDSDFNLMNKKIDEKMRATNMTCFSEVFAELPNVMDRIKKTYDNDFVLIFLTDGYPVVSNQGRERDNLFAALNKVKDKVAASMVVGYGDYYNRELLSQIAETLEGILIHSDELSDYVLSSDNFITDINGVQQIVELTPTYKIRPSLPLIYSPRANSNIEAYKVEGDKFKYLVKDGMTEDYVYYFTDKVSEGTLNKTEALNDTVALYDLYSAVYVLTKRYKFTEALEVLNFLGDVNLIDKLSNAVTNIEYSTFENLSLKAIFDSSVRYLKGYQENYLPNPNKFCIVDLVDALQQDDSALFYPFHENFKYTRTGRAMEYSEDNLKFTQDKSKGYPVNDLVWNKSRLNLSIRTKIDGYVTFKDTEWKKFKNLQETFETFIWKTYSLVTDGLLNVKELPVSLSEDTFNLLKKEKVISSEENYNSEKVYVINLLDLPITNKKMMKDEPSAIELGKLAMQEKKLEGAQKVWNYYKDALIPRTEKAKVAFEQVYGIEGAQYLMDRGITDSGFRAEGTPAESVDVRLIREFEIKIAGLSSLPKIVDVEASMASGKALKISETLMNGAIKEYKDFVKSLGTSASDAVQIAWLEGKIKEGKKAIAEVRKEIQKTKFVLILGKKKFKEFASRDEKELVIDGVKYTFDVSETQIKI